MFCQALASATPSLLGEDIDALLLSLKTFTDAKNFPALRAQLLQWATTHNSAMCAQALESELKQFLDAAQGQQALTELKFDGPKVLDLLGKIAKPMPQAVCQELINTFPHLFKQVLEKAATP